MACPTPSCLVSDEERKAKQTSTLIDKALDIEREKTKREVTILLLGGDESGKSTFLKQMRSFYGDDFDEAARKEYRADVYSSLVKDAKRLCQARERLGIPWGNPTNASHSELILYQPVSGYLDRFEEFAPIVTPLQNIWKDNGIQSTFVRRHELPYAIDDSAKYFFDRLDVIKEEDYIPSQKDVLLSRMEGRGIEEYACTVEKVPFRYVNVRKQGFQRTKWFQCFDKVTAIFYFVSSVGFDVSLLEVGSTQMTESLEVFNIVTSHRCFDNKIIILFFTDVDLLEEKIKTTNISEYFPDFPCSKDARKLEDVQEFIFAKFKAENSDPRRQLYHYFITATDSAGLRLISAGVRNIILSSLLQVLVLDKGM